MLLCGRYLDPFADHRTELWTESRPRWLPSAHLCRARHRGMGQCLCWLSVCKPSRHRLYGVGQTSPGRLNWRPIIAMSAIAESPRGDDRLMERSPEQPSSVFLPGHPSHRIGRALAISCSKYYTGWLKINVLDAKHPASPTSQITQSYF